MDFEQHGTEQELPRADQVDRPEKPEAPVNSREVEYERFRHMIGVIFDEQPSGAGRIELVKRRLGELVQFSDRQAEEVLSDLDACAAITDRKLFIEEVTRILRSVVDAKIDRPAEWEQVAREKFVREGPFVAVNQLLAYGINGDSMHLHVQPNVSTPLKDKIRLLKEGMRRIAEVVRDNPDIQHITGTSWLVAASPELMERLGFTVEGSVSEEVRQAHFAHETRPVHFAQMTREKLLERYG